MVTHTCNPTGLYSKTLSEKEGVVAYRAIKQGKYEQTKKLINLINFYFQKVSIKMGSLSSSEFKQGDLLMANSDKRI